MAHYNLLVLIFIYFSNQCVGCLLCVFLHSTLFSSFLTVLLSVCVLFLSGGASVLLSLGFSSWCDTVTNDNTRLYRCVTPGHRLVGIVLFCFLRSFLHPGVCCMSSHSDDLMFLFVFSCAESQSVPLYLDVDTSSFYTELSLAQVGVQNTHTLCTKDT